jgi:hypothetical protein
MTRKIILNIPDTEYDLTVSCTAYVSNHSQYLNGNYSKTVTAELSNIKLERCEIDEFANRPEGEAAAEVEMKGNMTRILDLLYREAVEQWI